MRKVALYSHDAMGLGHIRRNLAVARVLRRSGSNTILLIAGASEASFFSIPDGVDCLTLPALAKSVTGRYHSRSLSLSLGRVVALRAQTIRAALESFRPDVLIVDKLATGVEGELTPSLEALPELGTPLLVLGLRDVLDDPSTVRREWDETASGEVIRDRYDAVWVYGDPRVYDPVLEYQLSPEVAAKVRYTGYLHGDSAAGDGDGLRCTVRGRDSPGDGLPRGRTALCLVGGGADGYRLAEAFARAELGPDTHGVIVTGPFMPLEQRRRLERLALGRPLLVVDFTADAATLIERADAVVAMGGYNTVCELLSRGKRALIVPRVKPRREQLIRAERMRDLDLLDLLPPWKLDPRRLSEWLAVGGRPPSEIRGRIDLGGHVRLPVLLAELLSSNCAKAGLVPVTS